MTKKLDTPLDEIRPEWEALVKDADFLARRCMEYGIPAAVMIVEPENNGFTSHIVDETREDIRGNGAAMVLTAAVDLVAHFDEDASKAMSVIIKIALSSGAPGETRDEDGQETE